MENFADKLIKKIKEKKSCVCVGLDPRLSQIPKSILEKNISTYKNPFEAASQSILDFNKGIIDAVFDIVPIVKPQIAFYEQYGSHGLSAFIETIKYAKEKGLLTISDAKRNDIGTTAEAYAKAFLGKVDVFGEEVPMIDSDAITVTPYLGLDGIKPFNDECKKYGKGIFVLVKTSNPSSGDFQNCVLKDHSITNFELIGQLTESWGSDDIGESGYSFVGAVVGATYPKEADILRKIMPNSIFLVPGYGAQGGTAVDCIPCFNKDGLGAIVNNSRGIIFAYEKHEKYGDADYKEAAREATIKMNDELSKALNSR